MATAREGGGDESLIKVRYAKVQVEPVVDLPG